MQGTYFCHETEEFLRLLCQEAGWKHSAWLLSNSPSLIDDFTLLFSPLLSCPASHLLLLDLVISQLWGQLRCTAPARHGAGQHGWVGVHGVPEFGTAQVAGRQPDVAAGTQEPV